MKDAFGDMQNGTVYRSDFLHYRKLNIFNLRKNRASGSQFGKRYMAKTLALV
jgi:hypothetical protein